MAFPRNSTDLFYVGYIVPGFIDVHAHWGGFETAFPARSWEMATFLAYGVTTLHKSAPLHSSNALYLISFIALQPKCGHSPRLRGTLPSGARPARRSSHFPNWNHPIRCWSPCLSRRYREHGRCSVCLAAYQSRGWSLELLVQELQPSISVCRIVPFLLAAQAEVDASASRQRLLLAARELGMLCFPEGVGDILTIGGSVADLFAGYELRLGSNLYRRW